MTPAGILQTAGTILQVARAVGLASTWFKAPSCYAVMLAGAAAWLIAGILLADAQVIILNACWVALNIFGLVMWGRKR